jgi:hypothetical protein
MRSWPERLLWPMSNSRPFGSSIGEQEIINTQSCLKRLQESS